jgi:hypothetical protein
VELGAPDLVAADVVPTPDIQFPGCRPGEMGSRHVVWTDGSWLHGKPYSTGTTHGQGSSGYLLTIETSDDAGTQRTFRFSLVQQGLTDLVTVSSLHKSSLPVTGWDASLTCTPSTHCAPEYAVQGGWVSLDSWDSKSVGMAVCAVGTHGSDQITFFMDQTQVSASCAFGADQTCNLDPKISSMRGQCLPDGTCVCKQGEPDPVLGKCP